MKKANSLERAVFVALLPAILAWSLLSAIADYAAARRQILLKVSQETRENAGQTAAHLKTFFSQRRDDAAYLAESPLLSDYLKNLHYGLHNEAQACRRELTAHFEAFAARTRRYTRISYLDVSGREAVVAHPPEAPQPALPLPLPPKLLPGQAWDTGLPAQDGHSITFFAAVPSSNGGPQGYLALTSETSAIQRLLDALRVGSHGRVLLLGADGKPLLGPEAPLGRGLSAEVPVPETPWQVRVWAGPEEFVAPLRSMQQGVALLGILLLLPMLWWLKRRIRSAARPIAEMAESVRRLGSGETEVRSQTSEISELRTLGEAFNEMAAKLQERGRELEARLRQLAESEARYRAVVENSPVAVLGLSREHHITTWNQGAREIFGYEAEDILGKPLTALFPPGTEAEFQQLLAQMMARGSVRDHLLPGLAKGGRRLDLSLSWGGAHQDFWLNREWAVVIRDETATRRLRQQLIQSEKLAVVGQLISSIAHELNNPLQVVVGYSALLADPALASLGSTGGADPQECRAQLEQIHSNAQRCRKIIENLLLFVRQGGASRRVVSLNEAAQAARELLEYRLTKADNVSLELDVAGDLPPVLGNPQQLQQIFINLIGNACDAMAKQRQDKSVRIKARARDGRVCVEVTDSGPGVPAELREQIFEPFFTTKSEGRGTGLGLAICRQIMEDHGGSIALAQRPGRGATFCLEFPAAAAVASLPETPAALPRPSDGKSVLLVDDDPAVRELWRQLIEADGCTAEAAASLAQAQELARGRHFDLVVTDLLLGDGGGWELFERWDGRGCGDRPSFLFVTGQLPSAAALGALARQGLPLLHKPVEPEEFLRQVRGLLAQSSEARS